MKRNTIKHRAISHKASITLVLSIFLVSYTLQSLSPWFQQIKAEDPVTNTNIIALLVDESIYDDLTTEIQRYTTSYLQQKLSDTKAVVLPINTTEYMSWDIVTLLDNLYFEGIEDQTSTLIGTILIGDIPLPIIDDQGVVFESIYPYTDFVDPQYVFYEDSKSFAPNPIQQSNPQPEIWHSLIPFGDDIGAYQQFFEKLQTYHADPASFVEKKIWYDDFIQLKETFLANNLGYYANSFLYAEDLGYHRLTTLLMDLMKQGHNDVVTQALDDLGDAIADEDFEPNSDFEDFDQALGDYQDLLGSHLEGNEEMLAATATTQTPTLFLSQALKELMLPYAELFAPSYRSTMADRLESTGRWSIGSGEAHSHDRMTTILDDRVINNLNDARSPIMIDFNDLMEDALDQKIKDEQYAMMLPLLVRYEEHEKSIDTDLVKLRCGPIDIPTWRDNDRWGTLNHMYENFYWGTNAEHISHTDQLSIYRGEYLNFTGVSSLTGLDVAGDTPLGPLTNKSVGGTYGFNDRQVIASRGYNSMNVAGDLEKFNDRFDVMDGCEEDDPDDDDYISMEDFILYYRGGHSALNLVTNDQGDFVLNESRPELAWNPARSNNPDLSPHSIGGSLFDIGGSRLTDEEIASMYSVESLTKGSVQRTMYSNGSLFNWFKGDFGKADHGLIFRKKIYPVRYCDIGERDVYTGSISFFDAFQPDQVANWVTTTPFNPDEEQWICGKKPSSYPFYYYFKLIDSLQKNASPLTGDIAGFSVTTPDRPVTSIRNTTFQGLAGDIVTLPYPNLYHVSVYDEIQGKQILKQPDQIEQTLRDYLINTVDHYNEQLATQLSGSLDNYQSSTAGFDLLGASDLRATPRRTYNLLPTDFFIDLLPNDALTMISEQLYWQNLPWEQKRPGVNVMQDIEFTLQATNINPKISHILDNYLIQGQQEEPLYRPDYSEKGYEVAYINSDGQDYLTDPEAVPTIIADMQQHSLKLPSGQRDPQEPQTDASTICGYTIGEGLLIYDIKAGNSPWREAIKCWMEEIKKPLDVQLIIDVNGPLFFPESRLGIVTTGEESLSDAFGQRWDGSNNQYSEQWDTYAEQRRTLFERDKENEETLANSSEEEQKFFRWMLEYIDLDLSTSRVSVGEDIDARLYSSKDFDDITVTLTTEGTNCLGVVGGSSDLCGAPMVFGPSNLYDEAIPFKLFTTNETVGKVEILMDICKGNICAKNHFSIDVVPGGVEQVDIITPTNTAIKGSSMPVILQARDEYNNPVSYDFYAYKLSSDTGGFGDSNTAEVTIRDFSKANFMYRAGETATSDTLTVYQVSSTGTELLMATKALSVVDGIVAILDNNTPATSLSYTLPDHPRELFVTDGNDVVQANTDKLLPLQIKLQSPTGQPLAGMVTVSLRNQLMDVGVLVDKVINQSGNTSLQFQSQEMFIIGEDGTMDIALSPRGSAGDDVLSVAIEGLEEQNFPLTIKPGAAKKVEIHTTSVEIRAGESLSGSIVIRDMRDNAITQPTSLTLGTFGPVAFDDGTFQQTITTQGTHQWELLGDPEKGGTAYLYAQLTNESLDQQEADFLNLTVQRSYVPLTGLNTMYLNLRGQNRGEYLAEEGLGITDVFSSSDKLLAWTTQLHDPQGMKRIVFQLGDGTFINNTSSTPLLDFSTNQPRFTLAGEVSLALPTPQDRTKLSSWDDLQDFESQQNNQLIYISESANDPLLITELPTKKKDSPSLPISIKPLLDPEINLHHPSITIEASDLLYQGLIVWDVSLDGSHLGSLIFDRASTTLNSQNFTLLNPAYDLSLMASYGSTNAPLRNTLTERADYPSQAVYNSLEQSDDATHQIGFLGDFENISQFAQGLAVGESTQTNASALVINYGDPLLTRIGDNAMVGDSDYDDGRGQIIYSDNEKDIHQVIDSDMNNDGLIDMVVVHTDGTVRLLKNYGGDDNFVPLGDLILIGQGIKNVFVGDTDGNSYDDIVVQTTDDRLRVYTNNEGIIDVDGFPLCLDVFGGPDSFDRVGQLFVEDMDNDDIVDIVTNSQDGRIQIFWGGSSSAGANYISTDRYVCDDQRLSRQDNQTLKHLGLELDANRAVSDGSLIHREGLTYDPYANNDDADNPLSDMLDFYDQDPPEIDIEDPSAIDSLINMDQLLGQIGQSPLDDLVGETLGDQYRYRLSPIQYKPIYEQDILMRDLYYVPLYSLRETDPVIVEKYYTDQDGGILLPDDTVTVRVVLRAQNDVQFSYLDQISGPRTIEYEQGLPSGFDYGTLPVGLFGQSVNNSETPYIIDGIQLTAGQEVSYSYELQYRGIEMGDIILKDSDENTYTDVLLYPANSCMKARWDIMNQGEREFEETFNNLQETIDDYVEEAQENQSSMAENFSGMELLTNNIMEVWEGGSLDLGALEDWVSNGGLPDNFSIDLPDEVGEYYSEITDGLCSGFNPESSCKGLPLPFNMAFLSPGVYNVMGCRLMKDKGLPIFHFPGTLQTPVGPVPFPWGQKGPGDGFYRVSGGVYPSQIRVYLSPTLTMQLGLAVCFGPYGVGANLPKPLSHIGGNCIVTKIPLNFCGDDTSGADETPVISDELLALAEQGTCSDPGLLATAGNSATRFGVPVITSPFGYINVDLGGGTSSPALPGGGFGQGLISFDTESVGFIDDHNLNEEESVLLKGGQSFNLKIQGGTMKGLAQCIVQTWLDQQIKYMINNLTTMTVALYLPQFDNLTQGFDTLKFNMQQAPLLGTGHREYNPENGTAISEAQASIMRDYKLSQSVVTDFSQKNFVNPFESIAKMFEEVPLININTQHVDVQVPMIYTEDLLGYRATLETWIARNSSTAKDRKDIAQGILGTCANTAGVDPGLSDLEKASAIQSSLTQQRAGLMGELDTLRSQDVDGSKSAEIAAMRGKINTLDSCLDQTQAEKIDQLITFTANAENLITSVRQNINTLQQYKRFPRDLAAWMQSINKYILEIAQLVEGTMGQLTDWLDTNSRIFDQYVDAIILIIGVMKSRQLLVDLSVNWKKKCATCTNDNYDYFSCSLSFLCPKLPVLPIPPFKIPNIYIDMTHLDLGIDITLPTINMVPTAIPFPELPDLPPPPTVTVDIPSLDLPEIPIIPGPPKLPPLPDFIPRIEMTLPTLPPAPKIPQLGNRIQKILKIGENIGTLFCIMKGGIGLVGEASVKSKIEQLTQRTRQVPIFDYFDLTQTFGQTPLQGFDYQIDGYLDFNVNFDQAFDLVEGFADTSNDAVNKAVTDIQTSVSEANGVLRNPYKIPDVTITIEDDVFGWYDGYDEAQKDLMETLLALDTADVYNNKSSEIDDIRQLLTSRQKTITPEYHTELNKTSTDLQNLVATYQQQWTEMTTAFDTDEGYDRLVASLINSDNNSHILVAQAPMQLGSKLYGIDEKTQELLSRQENPLLTYMDTQKEIADGYAQALAHHDASTLGISPTAQQNTIAQYQDISRKLTVQTQQPHIPQESLIAQTTTPNSNAQIFDISSYIEGVFVAQASGNVSVVTSDQLIDEIGDNYYLSDINQDGGEDVILWTDNKLSIKYHSQSSVFDHGSKINHDGYYHYSLPDSPDDRGDNYTRSRLGTTLTLWNQQHSTKNLSIKGQNFDSLIMSWSYDPYFAREADGYLMKLSTRVDQWKDKQQDKGLSVDTFDKYMIWLPEGTDLDTTEVKIPEYNNYSSVASLSGDMIHHILFYDPAALSHTLTTTLTELSRNWWYVQVAPLGDGLLVPEDDDPLQLDLVAPWSNQVVAGQQVLSDDRAPEGLAMLERIQTDQMVSTGTQLFGYVGTYYTLHTTWEDDIAVVESWIEQDDVELEYFSGESVSLEGLYFTGAGKHTYLIGAMDSMGNRGTQTITVSIAVPEIAITDVEQVTDDLATITATIDQDIDEGIVHFERNIVGNWQILKTDPDEQIDREVYEGDTIVTGGLYTIGNDIGLYNQAEQVVATLDPATGEITLQGATMDILFPGGQPTIVISEGGSALFRISFPPKTLLENSIVFYDTEAKELAGVNFGIYDGGICISDGEQCLAYISKFGHIYVDTAYQQGMTATYSFDEGLGAVVYSLEYNGTTIADIPVIIEPLLDG